MPSVHSGIKAQPVCGGPLSAHCKAPLTVPDALDLASSSSFRNDGGVPLARRAPILSRNAALIRPSEIRTSPAKLTASLGRSKYAILPLKEHILKENWSGSSRSCAMACRYTLKAVFDLICFMVSQQSPAIAPMPHFMMASASGATQGVTAIFNLFFWRGETLSEPTRQVIVVGRWPPPWLNCRISWEVRTLVA